jgi:hypothetical protein
MHTMGLAFDIALINTPLPRVYEIRDVLSRMQQAGDLLVVGERKQLVFHVVPHPSRLGYFTAVYARAAAAALNRELIPSTNLEADLAPYALPVVSTEIVGFRPTDEFAAEWWAAHGAAGDLTVEVSAPTIGGERRSLIGRLTSRCVGFFSGLLDGARDIVARL